MSEVLIEFLSLALLAIIAFTPSMIGSELVDIHKTLKGKR